MAVALEQAVKQAGAGCAVRQGRAKDGGLSVEWHCGTKTADGRVRACMCAAIWG